MHNDATRRVRIPFPSVPGSKSWWTFTATGCPLWALIWLRSDLGQVRSITKSWCDQVLWDLHSQLWKFAPKSPCLKGEVRRKMNFTFVLGFVVLRDVVNVFSVSSPAFARKTTRKKRARSHSRARRDLMTKSDLKLVAWLLPVLAWSWPDVAIDRESSLAYRSVAALAQKDDPFQSFTDPSEIRWHRYGAREALPTAVSFLQKRIWKWDFYHWSSCNFFFHICFCHLWCGLPLKCQRTSMHTYACTRTHGPKCRQEPYWTV